MQSAVLLSDTQKLYHGNCPACSKHNPYGLYASYRVCPDGCVEAVLKFGKEHEGYAGHVHGGLITTVLDAAMTNCLFSYGITGVTGELSVRMFRPMAGEKAAVVRAWRKRRLHPLYVLSAELYEQGCVVARGEGKFVSKEIGEKE